jgi:hypothetical protein
MPDIGAARPVAGAPIETAWGQQAHDLIEGVQAGVGTVAFSNSSLSATFTITFPRPYLTPPIVLVSSQHVHYTAATMTAPTTTSVTGQMRRGDGSSQTGTLGFAWIAIGTPA